MSNNQLYTKLKYSNLVELGFVYSAYGIKGAIKVKSYSKQAEVLLTVNQWGLACLGKTFSSNINNNNMTVKFFTVVNSFIYKEYIIAYLSNINNRNESEILQGCKIYVQRDAFPNLNNDEYYYVDLIGCDFYGVLGNNITKIGIVNDILDNNAHPILKIHAQKNTLKKQNKNIEILVPFVKAYIEEVDLQRNIIISNWLIEE
ncbi:Ribosome maturation factor RimM [Candidatus Kinetoplastibacterium sorsogonicusi]|uniref:Ribosome maturation factor RimM n=1 Tax=Candidatus Kinetoplastidibacterium kentomonadis TaxID=1576550 RepID=A0A3S7JA09_9PROT|nr:ribosome maturation factor RimM [Candidatus Kinetoplastibacterium sorsogonicusi]AWD32499.1 Ribosome maturation factor RimM [Candidatus Kinetoplastibacterium sorsogonicusi]